PENSKIKYGAFSFTKQVVLQRVLSIIDPNQHDFIVETKQGKQFTLRAKSEASKQIWMHMTTYCIADTQLNYQNHVRLRRNSDVRAVNMNDFYMAYKYLWASLSALEDETHLKIARLNQTDRVVITPETPLSQAVPIPNIDRIIPRLISMCHPDNIIRSTYLPAVPFHGAYNGSLGFLEYMTKLTRSAKFISFEIQSMTTEISNGQRVVVVNGQESMQVRATGKLLSQQWCHKFRFMNECRIYRWEIFGDATASATAFTSLNQIPTDSNNHRNSLATIKLDNLPIFVDEFNDNKNLPRQSIKSPPAIRPSFAASPRRRQSFASPSPIRHSLASPPSPKPRVRSAKTPKHTSKPRQSCNLPSTAEYQPGIIYGNSELRYTLSYTKGNLWPDAPIPPTENARLERIQELDLCRPREDFELYVKIACKTLHCSMGAVCIVGGKAGKFVAKQGIPAESIPRDILFESHVLMTREPLIVLDTSIDMRFAMNPLVRDGISLFIGIPLITSDNLLLGALSLLSTKPRSSIREADIASLVQISQTLMNRLEDFDARQSAPVFQRPLPVHQPRRDEDVCRMPRDAERKSPSTLPPSSRKMKIRQLGRVTDGKPCELANEILADSVLGGEERLSTAARKSYQQSFVGLDAAEVSSSAEEDGDTPPPLPAPNMNPFPPNEMLCRTASGPELLQREPSTTSERVRSLSASNVHTENVPKVVGLRGLYEPSLSLHWEGYLMKRSDWLKHWETYYFVLHGRVLCCYLSEDDARLHPENSKIKDGRFTFSDKVVLDKVIDLRTHNDYDNTISPTNDVASPHAPMSSPKASKKNMPFRFIFETQNAKKLQLRAKSEACKQLWMHMATHGIADTDMESGGLRRRGPIRSVGLADFYAAYEYMFASLCEMEDRLKMFQNPKRHRVSAEVVPNSPMTSHQPKTDHIMCRLFSLLELDVVLRSNYLPMVPFAGTYREYNGILEYFTNLSKAVRFKSFSVDGMSCEGQSEKRIVVVSGKETMQVRVSNATFMQHWVHKLHFRDDGRISRWEIFGDVVASSVVFKPQGFAMNLTLPSHSERVRESFVGGYGVSIKLKTLSGIHADSTQRYMVRCAFENDNNEWHTEAQTKSITATSTEGEMCHFDINQDIFLQLDSLSRDDNTLLGVQFCLVSTHEVLARTTVNLAYFFNRAGLESTWQTYTLSNENESFFGKLTLSVHISALSQNPVARLKSASSSSSLKQTQPSFPWLPANRPSTTGSKSIFSSFIGDDSEHSGSGLERKASLSLVEAEPDKGLHQFIIGDATFTVADKYRMVKVVGKGTYGVVIAASDCINGGTYAIKKIAQFMRHPKVAMLAFREIQLMNKVGAHPNIMGIHELQKPLSFETFDDLYIVQALMETDLCRVIHSKEHLSDEHIQYLMYQLLCGIRYIHSANVLHRDLKPSNVLINSDCFIKICDFGLARFATDQDLEEGLSEYVVTRWYRAPELLLANTYATSIDVWSVGCIFGELLGRRVLFPGKSYVDQLKVIIEVVGTPSTFSFCDNPSARRFAGRQLLTQSPYIEKVAWTEIFPHANPEALSLLDKLLQFDPSERITAEEALQHPYFDSCRDAQLESIRFVPAAGDKPPANIDYRKVKPAQLKRLLYNEVMRDRA
ncbi:serine/threonine protein kinase, partial [Thraustotheca clavata]